MRLPAGRPWADGPSQDANSLSEARSQFTKRTSPDLGRFYGEVECRALFEVRSVRGMQQRRRG